MESEDSDTTIIWFLDGLEQEDKEKTQCVYVTWYALCRVLIEIRKCVWVGAKV